MPAVDVVRMAAALRVPGSDPRMWVSLAVVDKVVMDAKEGYFADVTLLPSLEKETARVGTEYAGSGFGTHIPVKVGDEVVVTVPDGDSDEGPVITKRLHSPADLPPSDAVTYATDLVTVVESGVDRRVAVSGGGRIRLGTVATNHPCFQADDWNSAWATLDAKWTLMQTAWAAVESAWTAFLNELTTYIILDHAGRNASPAKENFSGKVSALTSAISAHTSAQNTYKAARATFKQAAIDAETTELRVD